MTWSFFELVFCNRTFLPVFAAVFSQSQTHCYKGAITLRQTSNHPHAGFATVFFAIAAHQWLQPHCKGCCNHLYCQQIATTLSKHQPSRNLTVSWLELFLTGFLQSHFFTCFLQLFFLQSQSHAVFATVFFAITLR
jgi:hypothetical protein